MKRAWEFCENMNEIVYVADVDTYEIIYANRKVRDMYGIKSLDELKGKKCYEFFQASGCPCAFCNNRDLKEGYFEEWNYFNPILQKHFSIKDTIGEYEGRKVRIEIAIDMTAREIQKETIEKYASNEAMINEALKLALSFSDAQESIDVLLEYTGKALNSQRIYIFEAEKGLFSNTYEWCANEVKPQIDNLQNIPMEVAKIWLKIFEGNKNVIIEDIEDIRESDPEMYALLVPQDIHTLVASPLFYNGEIMGFYGVDNPPVESMKNISTLLQIMGHFIVALIRRKRLMDRLENLSYCDHLTGFGNRHAMNKYVKSINRDKSLGIVYCDVMGLKRVNDVMGHSEGDRLLQRACSCIKEVFTTDSALFRIGGDEFLVLCSGLDEKKFRGNIELVRALMLERCANMAIGSLWRSDGSEDFEKLLGEADGLMYEEKRKYYSGLPKKY